MSLGLVVLEKLFTWTWTHTQTPQNDAIMSTDIMRRWVLVQLRSHYFSKADTDHCLDRNDIRDPDFPIYLLLSCFYKIIHAQVETGAPQVLVIFGSQKSYC